MHTPQHHPIFRKISPWQGLVPSGFAANCLGVLTRRSFFGNVESPRGGLPRFREEYFQLDAGLMYEHYTSGGPPLFNEEYFEWIDLLESVFLADEEFTMVELGAGWGRWIAAGAVAARTHRGIGYRVVGVEAEPTHFRWMKTHFRDNGLASRGCDLVRAAVTDSPGSVWFWVGRPDEWYGQAIAPEPQAGPRPRWWDRFLGRHGPKTNDPPEEEVVQVPAVTLTSLLEPLSRVDLIDLDVQGAEGKVLEAAAAAVDAKVRRVHIGTHNAEVEADLRRLFGRLGWSNVNDYACGREHDTPYGKIAFQDGVQTWINPRV